MTDPHEPNPLFPDDEPEGLLDRRPYVRRVVQAFYILIVLCVIIGLLVVAFPRIDVSLPFDIPRDRFQLR